MLTLRRAVLPASAMHSRYTILHKPHQRAREHCGKWRPDPMPERRMRPRREPERWRSPMKSRLILTTVFALVSSTMFGAAVTFQACGANPAAIQPTVDAYRTALGALNPNTAGSFPSGRREINWDGVPDALAAPNNLPANFFNVNSPRGVVFATPGTGFQVSANSVNPTSTPIEFGNLNATYPGSFTTFSAQRLFTALGSNITDVVFFVAGSSTPAFTTGFGA